VKPGSSGGVHRVRTQARNGACRHVRRRGRCDVTPPPREIRAIDNPRHLERPPGRLAAARDLLGFVLGQRVLLFLLWFALWPALLISLRWPTAAQLDGIAPRASVVGLVAIGLLLFWVGRGARATLLGVLSLIGAVAMLPGSEQSNLVRFVYVQQMGSAVGTPYAARFEDKPGVSCSDLVRGTLAGVNLRLGLLEANPLLLREGVELWLHDCSASELADDCHGKLLPLFRAASIDQIDESRLEPGDIAVTRDGRHSLAYIGDHRWIQADPLAGRVTHLRASARNPWFQVPVQMLRWAQLEGWRTARRS
jgi:hypothetical protein